jgi:hypothetical protein
MDPREKLAQSSQDSENNSTTLAGAWSDPSVLELYRDVGAANARLIRRDEAAPAMNNLFESKVIPY